jgi:hypothetical protein
MDRFELPLTLVGRALEVAGFFLVIFNFDLRISSRWGMGIFILGIIVIKIRDMLREIQEEPLS